MGTKSTNSEPERWLRGAVPDVHPLVMPVAHALLQAKEDIQQIAANLPAGHLWQRPGAAASVGFHLLHLAGSLDRLLTYARGKALDAQQRTALNAEGSPEQTGLELAAVAAHACTAIDRALQQVRETDVSTLLDSRQVGRAGLPSTVLGLLVHAAEHTTRHVGQAITTAKALER
jgi:hypothetical protein